MQSSFFPQADGVSAYSRGSKVPPIFITEFLAWASTEKKFPWKYLATLQKSSCEICIIVYFFLSIPWPQLTTLYTLSIAVGLIQLGPARRIIILDFKPWDHYTILRRNLLASRNIYLKHQTKWQNFQKPIYNLFSHIFSNLISAFNYNNKNLLTKRTNNI